MAYSVVVLDDVADMAFVVAQLIQTMTGAQCLTVGSVEELKARASCVLPTKLALLDVNLGEGQLSGIDAYHWLREQNYSGQACFLTGHARYHPLVVAAMKTGATVLEKPFAADDFASVVTTALAREEPASGVTHQG